MLRKTLCEHVNGLCPAGWLNEQSITKHWFQPVRTCPYCWATGRNSTLKALLSKVGPLQAKPKEMVRAEPTNNRTAGINTSHSTIFTLLLELLLNVTGRPVTRGAQGGEAPLQNFSLPLEECVDHRSKLLDKV